jgi:hypothetical protein
MSTIAEHLALIEALRLTNRNDAAHQESWLFTNVHWQDLVAMVPADEMESARVQTEQRLRDQHPAHAEKLIADWREKRPTAATQAKATQPAQASGDRDAYEGAREDLLDWKRRAVKAEAALAQQAVSEPVSTFEKCPCGTLGRWVSVALAPNAAVDAINAQKAEIDQLKRAVHEDTVLLDMAMNALNEIALAGMSGSGQESEEGMRDWHARRAWDFIAIAARAKTAIRAARAAAADGAGEA